MRSCVSDSKVAPSGTAATTYTRLPEVVDVGGAVTEGLDAVALAPEVVQATAAPGVDGETLEHADHEPDRDVVDGGGQARSSVRWGTFCPNSDSAATAAKSRLPPTLQARTTGRCSSYAAEREARHPCRAASAPPA